MVERERQLKAQIEQRLSELRPFHLRFLDTTAGRRVFVTVAGEERELSAKRETLPVGRDDWNFIAHCFSDVPILLRMGSETANPDLRSIRSRVSRVSRGPWTPFLERMGGSGGCNVIQVGKYPYEEDDLYLWVGADLAPDPIFLFVAEARQDIPMLLEMTV